MKADRDPTYIMLTEAAKAEVAEKGKFLMHDVIVGAGFAAFEDKISNLVQWPKVRENVEHDAGRLTPIAADNQNGGQWDPEIHPEKFLPGSRRKTIGYALASTMPKVAEAYLRRRIAVIGGLCKSVDAIAISFQQQGLSIAYTPGSGPMLALPPQAAE